MSLIEININNSFNKGKDQQPDKVALIKNDSTLSNNHFNNIEVSSINVTSLTNSAVNSQIGSSKRKTVVREIFIAVASSLITYTIIHFLNSNWMSSLN